MVGIRSTLQFPPDFARARFEPKLHALENSSELQAKATFETQLARAAHCLGLSDCVTCRTRLEDNDAFLAETATSALSHGIWVPNEKQFR